MLPIWLCARQYLQVKSNTICVGPKQNFIQITALAKTRTSQRDEEQTMTGYNGTVPRRNAAQQNSLERSLDKLGMGV